MLGKGQSRLPRGQVPGESPSAVLVPGCWCAAPCPGLPPTAPAPGTRVTAVCEVRLSACP